MSYIVAASYGDENMVKLLLKKGANKDVHNKYGKIAYDLAVEHGHTKLFDTLKLGDRLCMAARKGEAQQIHQLLKSGAAINGCDQHKWTALHRASLNRHTKAVKALLEKGIDVKDEDRYTALHCTTESGHTEARYTALHCTTESGHTEAMDILVKKRANMEAMTNKGLSALQIAESLVLLP